MNGRDVTAMMDNVIKKGSPYPNNEPAKLGYFETEEGTQEKADNVLVLVVHFDFKEGKDDWPRPGDDKDVQNLREAFETNRKCRFRERLSPTREDLIDLLEDGHKIKRLFESDDLEPDLFFLIILSHGAENGIIFTDTLDRSSQTNKYETFTTKEVIDSIGNLFPKCLKFVILGPCRGRTEDTFLHSRSKLKLQNNVTKKQNFGRISIETKIRNLFVLYSTVETTMSNRDSDSGTWLVKFLCEQLNEMTENESVLKFLTGTLNRVHQETAESSSGQTPEFHLFTCDKKFCFLPLDLSNQENSIHFDWWNEKSNSVLRRRRAIIFHQGDANNKYIKNLENALVRNLSFETVISDINTVDHYLGKQENVSRYKYGCFSAFFFAEIREMEGQICISVGEKERRTLGELTHGLLGVQNDDWIGKPKLLFLIDQNCVATDQQPTTRRITPRIKSQRVLGATNHNGWYVVVLRNRSSHFLEQFIKVFENQKLKDKQSSLQELVGELLTTSNDDSGNTVTIVSTLAHLLSFPDLEQNFFHPHFELDGNTERFESIISRARFIYRTSMWLLTSAPGSGKTTMFREILFRMQRAVNSDVKVYLIFLVRVSHLFHAAKSKRQTEPSLASIVAHVSGNLEEDIQNLIDTKKIVLMFDGFDEISKNYGAEVLKIFAEALKQEVTIWVSTRQHEEDAILQHVDQKVDIRRIKICPLSDTEQIRFLMILSQKSFHDCKLKIKLYERNGHEDVLKSPLHLKMIAELDDSAVIEKFDLYDIYENVVDQQLRLTLTLFKEGTLAYEKARDSIFKDLKGISADFLSTGTTATKLKNINNGLATITNGHVRFVHQTFAEFFAATYFIDCLFDDLEMPFDIFRDEFRGVRKFVDLRISIEKQSSKVFAVLEKHLNETLTRQILFKIIWDERLGAFSYASSRLVSLVESSKLNFMYSDIDYIMEKASEYSEIFAVEILEKGAFSKFKWPEDTAAKMLINAIEKNFASLLLKLEEKVENLKLLAQRDKKRLYKAVRLGIKWNNHEVLKLVLEKEYTEHTEEFMGAHLELAVRHCSAECVEQLIDHGAHTTDLYEFQDLDQYTASALLKTKEETLPKLAAEIFTVALESKNVEAAMAVHDRFVNNKMADFDISNRALYEVIQWNRYPEEVEVLCRWLVERCGFDIYDQAAMGCNALHCAAQYGHHGLVKYFLEKDPNLIESMTESQCDVLCHTIFGFKGSKDFYPPDFEFIEEIIICPGIQQIISVLDTLHTYNSEMIKRKSDGDKTLLHMVLERFHFERFEICKWLIENGVDAEAADDRGWNAFHYFTRANMAENDDRGKRDLNMIISLLSETIPECVKQRTKKGETVLHFAAKSNHIGVTDFEWLASQQGLELGDVDHRGWNVLHFAMHDTDMAGWFCNESEEKMRFILETQPSLLQSVTESGEKIMHFIANNKDHHGRTLKYMKFVHNLDKELVSQKTASNKTVLHYAAGSGNMKLCQWLLDEVGLEVDAVDDESCNVIHHAAVHSNVDLQLLKYLHEKNPQLIHKRTNRHQTVLHLVARNEKLSVCQWLVDEIGLAVDALDAERWNAVHYASYNTTYRLDFIKYFHEKNPDVIRQKTKKNQTMLHLAAERGNLQVCEWLSEEIGLEVDAEDDDGWNVMHFDTYNTSYDLRLIKYLHRKNPHLVKKKTNRNQTVLLLAVKNDLLEKCKWLVEEAGAEVDAVDDEGWNVFHYAASYIHDSKTGKLSAVEMFEYLLLKSPSCLLKKKTNRNETVLHLVAKNESGLRPKERYEWLVSAGVDASELDVDGKTAMQVASQHFISRYNSNCFNKNEWYN